MSDFGDKVKCFGQQAALCVEATFIQKNSVPIPTVNLEVAPRQDENILWNNKIVLQLSERELPELNSVLLGYLPSVYFKRPGKGIEVIRQPGKLFIRASQGQGQFYLLPIGIGDTFKLSAFLLRALKKQCGLSDETLILAALRGAATLTQVVSGHIEKSV